MSVYGATTRSRIPATMHAVLLTGHGGVDKLEYRTDVPVPTLGPDEVLVEVKAAGVNNTDINTRIGWYSPGVRTETNAGAETGFGDLDRAEASWAGAALAFPRIQGGDCCGHVVAVGAGVDPSRTGERVIIHPLSPRQGSADRPCRTYGSESDGAFAQYTKVPAHDAIGVSCDWSDEELASIPVNFSTAENMLHRAAVEEGERVLVTGASGGVGSAAVQLAARRRAIVTAVTSASRADEVAALGAHRVVTRDTPLLEEFGPDSFDAVIDVVGGGSWPSLIEVVRFGGRYAVAGAIAGPIVELDLRRLYLRDLTFFGCTCQDGIVFANVVKYVERGEIRPTVAKSYPLSDIKQAQTDFIAKRYAGKLILMPPDVSVL